MVFDAVSQRSTKEEVEQYITNLAQYDYSRPFDQLCAEYAALLASDKMNDNEDFSELSNYGTSGSTIQVRAGTSACENHGKLCMEHLRSVKPTRTSAASGAVIMDKALMVNFERVDRREEVQFLLGVPALCSAGETAGSLFSFHWGYSFLPRLAPCKTKN